MSIYQLGGLALALLSSACSITTTSPNLYQWDNYQETLYQYYQPENSTLGEQATALEKTVAIATLGGKTVPPGLHAHLGLLYSKLGETEKALQQFAIEKQLFPESALFMNLLLKKQPRGES